MANISLMILVLFFLSTSFGTNNAAYPVPWPRPPAVFIFGDSTSDVGTNNYINTTARANHKHYGIDYEYHEATGRWSNGFNMIDYLCQMMGFDRSPPPYLKDTPRSGMPTEVVDGFNFASGGSGLFNETTYKEGVVPVLEQVDQFKRVRAYLVKSMGHSRANRFLSESIFILSIGSNDIIRTFQSDEPSSWPRITLPKYMKNYLETIVELYDQGARTFGFISPLPIGCLPMIRNRNETGGCITEQNDVSIFFYNQLDTTLYALGYTLRDFRYSLGNTYKILMNIISESKNPATACCGSGKLNAEIFCNANTNLCNNRDEYAFWDGAHPTAKSAEKLAYLLYTGDQEVTTPINFLDLVSERPWSMSRNSYVRNV